MNDQQFQSIYNRIMSLTIDVLEEVDASTSSHTEAFAHLVGLAAMFHEATDMIWDAIKHVSGYEDSNA